MSIENRNVVVAFYRTHQERRQRKKAAGRPNSTVVQTVAELDRALLKRTELFRYVAYYKETETGDVLSYYTAAVYLEGRLF